MFSQFKVSFFVRVFKKVVIIRCFPPFFLLQSIGLHKTPPRRLQLTFSALFPAYKKLKNSFIFPCTLEIDIAFMYNHNVITRKGVFL